MVVAHFVVRSLVGSIRPWKSLVFNSVISTGAAWTMPDGASTTAPPTATMPATATVNRRRNFDLIVSNSLVTVAVLGT